MEFSCSYLRCGCILLICTHDFLYILGTTDITEIETTAHKNRGRAQ